MASSKPILYGAWISSCSHRIRIVLNLKEVSQAQLCKVTLYKTKEVWIMSTSQSILGQTQYLEDKYPQHALLPKDLKKKALNLQITNIVCSSIQPLQGYAVITKYPILAKLHDVYMENPAFQAAVPKNQPDAPSC
uniref:GST N-terminal domain-containing protein n=1 Tax=Leersia perrieri TaxID=77586 RepID=A0A0D9XXT4_9ORYZ